MTEKLKCVYSLMAKTVLIKIILTVINYITEFSNYSWSHRTVFLPGTQRRINHNQLQ